MFCSGKSIETCSRAGFEKGGWRRCSVVVEISTAFNACCRRPWPLSGMSKVDSPLQNQFIVNFVVACQGFPAGCGMLPEVSLPGAPDNDHEHEENQQDTAAWQGIKLSACHCASWASAVTGLG